MQWTSSLSIEKYLETIVLPNKKKSKKEELRLVLKTKCDEHFDLCRNGNVELQ